LINAQYSSHFDATPAAVFAFHERPDALALLTPPWERVEVVSRDGGLEQGARVELRLGFGLLRRRWVAVHTEYVKNRLFTDVAERGPFAFWEHRHIFEPEGEGCRLTDAVRCALPMGWLTEPLLGWAVKARLKRMFDYRHEVTRRHLETATPEGPVTTPAESLITPEEPGSRQSPPADSRTS
jgi:ligand-binding SRPBCC domain-containing protein